MKVFKTLTVLLISSCLAAPIHAVRLDLEKGVERSAVVRNEAQASIIDPILLERANTVGKDGLTPAATWTKTNLQEPGQLTVEERNAMAGRALKNLLEAPDRESFYWVDDGKVFYQVESAKIGMGAVFKRGEFLEFATSLIEPKLQGHITQKLALPEVPSTIKDSISKGLRQIRPIDYENIVYRNVNTKYADDYANTAPSKNFRFRYNAEKEFGAGYYAETPEQTFYEMRAHGNDPFLGRTVVQAKVRAQLLDLTNPKNLEILGISERQITSPGYSIPIEIARQAREMGFEGIRAPQGGGSGKANIVLFPDKFRKDSYILKVQEQELDLKPRP